MQRAITMLGTGDALSLDCFNTCFVLQDGRTRMLVDAGGGNGVLLQLRRAGIRLEYIDYMFVSHTHTDHILGAVWIVRMVAHQFRHGLRTKTFEIVGCNHTVETLISLCKLTLNQAETNLFGTKILFKVLSDGAAFSANDIRLKAFDTRSEKCPQFGFRATLSNGLAVVFCGDEPLHKINFDISQGADLLLHEAFCTEEDSPLFSPHEKSHGTASEAGATADCCGVKRLLLYHSAEPADSQRAARYKADAARYFKREILVPADLEVIDLGN